MISDVGRSVVGELIDVANCVVAPGLVDVHVHLRQPGGEESETFATGTAAAAAGGYTAVCAMANTDPVIDTAELLAHVRALTQQGCSCDVYQTAAITKGLGGRELVDVAGLAEAGVRYLSDDGRPVASAAVMREALAQAASVGIVIGNHSEEPTLTVDAQANEGAPAKSVGMPGWPHEAEEVMIARDLLLAEGVGARIHIPHVSTAGSVDLVRSAKQRGVRVTAEATPHHFALTDELVRTGDSVYKVNPPLRARHDVDAIRAGLKDGTLDVIATDHAPHAPSLKAKGWHDAPCGMLGLETALALTLTLLVDGHVLTLLEAVAALSYRPARAMSLTGHGGPLVPGAPANIVVFDPAESWTVAGKELQSKSTNSPFEGFRLKGKVKHTLLNGAFTFFHGALPS